MRNIPEGTLIPILSELLLQLEALADHSSTLRIPVDLLTNIVGFLLSDSRSLVLPRM